MSPHKYLWHMTDADGASVNCELDALSRNRVLLTVTRNGERVVTESFADKRDALARSVALHHEWKRRGTADSSSKR